MKRIISAITATTLLLSPLSGYCMYDYPSYTGQEYNLSQKERDRVILELKFTIKKLHGALDKADKEARQITDVDVEMATRAAIAGATASIKANSVYAGAIGVCLAVIGSIAGDSFIHFKRSRSHLQDAQYYAYHADELQERLWRNQ